MLLSQLFRCVGVFAFLTMSATPALAQEADTAELLPSDQTALELRTEQVVAIINADLPPEEVFTQGFLTAVPLPQLEALMARFTGQFGPALSVESLSLIHI